MQNSEILKISQLYVFLQTAFTVKNKCFFCCCCCSYSSLQGPFHSTWPQGFLIRISFTVWPLNFTWKANQYFHIFLKVHLCVIIQFLLIIWYFWPRNYSAYSLQTARATGHSSRTFKQYASLFSALRWGGGLTSSKPVMEYACPFTRPVVVLASDSAELVIWWAIKFN